MCQRCFKVEGNGGIEYFGVLILIGWGRMRQRVFKRGGHDWIGKGVKGEGGRS